MRANNAAYEAVGRELMRAIGTDFARSQHRQRTRRLAATIAIAVLLLTAAAAIASPKVAETLHDAGASLLHVFDRPGRDDPSPQARDRIDAMDDVNALNPPHMNAGDPLEPGTGRTLLTHTDDQITVEIYARPTTRAGLCYEVVLTGDPAGSGGDGACFEHFAPRFPVNTGHSAIVDDVRLMLWGVASNDVRQVRVRSTEGPNDVVNGDHAFFWRARTSADIPTAIEVELADGRVLTRALDIEAASRRGTEIQAELDALRGEENQ